MPRTRRFSDIFNKSVSNYKTNNKPKLTRSTDIPKTIRPVSVNTTLNQRAKSIDMSTYYFDEHDSSSIGSPRGFLSFVDTTTVSTEIPNNTKTDLCASLKHQYFILCTIFPDFPKLMIKTLLIREQGNTKQVYIDLKKHGWKPSNTQMLQMITCTSNQLFSIPYYWGEIKPEHLKVLKKQKPGDYFTAIENHTSYIYYKDISDKIQKRQCPSINVDEIQKKTFSLRNHLDKPKYISQHDLIFFVK